MDSRASTSTSTFTTTSKSKSFIIDTNHSTMVSAFSPSSSFAAFRPSPLNPKAFSSPCDKSNNPHKRSPPFPASRPLRPFPSIIHSVSTSKKVSPEAGVRVRDDGSLSDLPVHTAAAPISATTRSPKTIEISSKWKGGFLVLGMTQAEFSRRD